MKNTGQLYLSTHKHKCVLEKNINSKKMNNYGKVILF